MMNGNTKIIEERSVSVTVDIMKPEMNFNSKLSQFVLVITLLYSVQAWTEYELTGVDNSNEGPICTDLRVSRVNKTLYALKGLFNITVDFSNAYDIETRMYYSSKGNNQYTMLPFKVPKSALCVFMDGFYRNIASPGLEATSNFPKVVEGKPVCPLFVKGTYTINNYPMDKKSVSQVYREGLYKCELLFTKSNSNDVASRLILHGKLY